MALTDEKPIEILAANYRPAHQSELAAWLQKEAEGGIKPEDNEATPKKPAVDLYEDPPGRKDGQNLDARWGEETPGELNHHNDGTYDETKKDRVGALGKAFAKMPAAERQDSAALNSLFDHAKSGRFTTHSALLLGKAKEAAAPAPTLADRVRRATGRF